MNKHHNALFCTYSPNKFSIMNLIQFHSLFRSFFLFIHCSDALSVTWSWNNCHFRLPIRFNIFRLSFGSVERISKKIGQISADHEVIWLPQPGIESKVSGLTYQCSDHWAIETRSVQSEMFVCIWWYMSTGDIGLSLYWKWPCLRSGGLDTP